METRKVFSHEKQAFPPALSTGGKQRIGVKADQLSCLESDLVKHNNVSVADAKILDRAAVFQMLNLITSRTFQEYGETVFSSNIFAHLEKSTRIDLVWDVYYNW